MYELTRAYCRRFPGQSRWEAFDAAAEPITTLSATYGDVWLYITYPTATVAEKALRLHDVANRITRVGDPTTTVQEWLTGLGNETLPFADEVPTFTAHYVRYVNAWHAGYDVHPIARNGTLEQGGSDAAKEDLQIKLDGVDPYQLGDYGMFTINGLFHPIDVGPNGVYIRYGNDSLRRANDNQIGVYSFADVGKVQYVPITADMITPQRPGEPLRNAAYVTLPDDVDLTGKTAMVVIGGYLHVLGKGYTRTGEKTFRIQLQRLSLLERYYDSVADLDMSSLGLSEYDHNASLLSVDEIRRDSAILAYLTLPQSFFVLVDADTMFHEWEAIEPVGLADRYVLYEYEYLPLVGAYGRGLEHHVIYESPYHLISATPNLRHHYDFQTRPWKKQKAVDSGRYPAWPAEPAVTYIRRLGIER